MEIGNAKVGMSVRCPADRGDPAFTGEVTSVDPTVHKNIAGHDYQWVEVRGPRHKSVWPSNRLG